MKTATISTMLVVRIPTWRAHRTHTVTNDSWRVLPTWKRALDAPGATQPGILKKTFMDRKEWWRLVPDQTIFASGGNTSGQILNLAARHEEGQWIMVYLGAKTSFSIDLSKMAKRHGASAFWIDPRNADRRSVGALSSMGTQSFSTPAGWEDALFIVESTK
jgi:hypothetical protein